ncbi:MAG: tRNA (adenosine(37)-N6)-threonylcarbamoyltransferase complex transferase subunit TsaD [Acholeplasmatales bacterium]|jgi:N6-L-threonylcarbamoyladenine synthase|nr:tRNA (adenosine(37)-N6)-threonylcarbamoyltransferase complex transferase subunit TsaD [Acholeplasmatales bacterium]
MIILSVETSCDETSVAISIDGKQILSNIVLSQIDIHTLYGGVVPEIASRNHTKFVLEVFIRAINEAKIKISDINLIAVTNGPGLMGSLLVGVSAALAFGLANNIKVIGVNHLLGHIFSSNIDNDIVFPAVSLLVSGGHTDLIYLEDYYTYKVLGVTLDDAVGETYDKVARILGLGYPGGPIIDKEAKKGVSNIKFPVPKVDLPYHFSFSGLKSAVLNKYNSDIKTNEKINISDYASSFQDSVLKQLLSNTKKAVNEYKVNTLILAGGVSANSALRELFKNEFSNINLLIPKFAYCTDNAAMIGRAGYLMYLKNKKTNDEYILKTYSTARFSDL